MTGTAHEDRTEYFKKRAGKLSCGIYRGHRASDGLFEESPSGPQWLAFQEREDLVLWSPKLNLVSSVTGRAFALNETAIGDAATYALDHSLNIFASVSRWILANGDGIVVLQWPRAFDSLRHSPRICLDHEVRRHYYDNMRPARMPSVRVRQASFRSVAA
ncbi:hypothetical protein FVA81_24080 [Rhizobium sp. WL3]|uniref:hypothetical protein n=1 Tax=Rhizobium sp. WL3 TaxID=2603277 RepID=UPI0011C1F66B|nr:hypothetical protein [Rhizobium sp. WL3]QEE47495.1 hypothetical protein FVA81_24080 [Rhizobium sp. WL3]